MGKTTFFTDDMKLADLLTANHRLILMLPRFNLPLGFGEKRVKDICAENGISAQFFLLICNVYTFENYVPAIEHFVGMEQLVPYLSASHKFYLQERLPHIEHHLMQILNKVDSKYGSTIKHFFDNYKHEVEEHFAYEESVVFPYLCQLINQHTNEKYAIKEFAATHSNIEDNLNDLIQIVFKYLPGNKLLNESIELIFDIMQLSTDLQKHQLIEEKILIPYVAHLESKL